MCVHEYVYHVCINLPPKTSLEFAQCLFDCSTCLIP